MRADTVTAEAQGTTCPYCRESVGPETSRCPHCREMLRTPAARSPRELVAAGLAGLAAGIFLIGVANRLFAGPLPDMSAIARSLRFLEMAGASVVLLLLANLVTER